MPQDFRMTVEKRVTLVNIVDIFNQPRTNVLLQYEVLSCADTRANDGMDEGNLERMNQSLKRKRQSGKTLMMFFHMNLNAHQILILSP